MNEVLALAPFDFHVHTRFSPDGAGTMLEYCEQAVGRGMKAIGFCDHLELDDRDVNYECHDYEGYRAAVEEARRAFAGRLLVRMGVEVGFVPRVRERICEYLAGREYDFVVGSVHAIDDGLAGISDEYGALETFARHEVMEVYQEYFELVREMVVSGLFDVVGHFDLVQRYGVKYLKAPVEWGRFYGLIRQVFEGAIKRQMAVEINGSGLRQNPEATYPPRDLLRIYQEVGGELVILGSDAHRPEDLGAGVSVGYRLARGLFLSPVSFQRRLVERVEV